MDEFELTYLPKKELMTKLPGCRSVEMLDIYIPVSAHHPTLRIRKIGDRCMITKKEPVKEGDSSHQFENTIPLTDDEFTDLSQLAGKRVHKTRYYFEDGGYIYEIDVFHDDLAGLVMVDVEFGSVDAKSRFVRPQWCSIDVTQEKFLAGGMLCGKKYEDIAVQLENVGYERILF